MVGQKLCFSTVHRSQPFLIRSLVMYVRVPRMYGMVALVLWYGSATSTSYWSTGRNEN